MIFDIDNFDKNNYQTANVNRFVIDSDRFWRKEFHPYFKDVFTMEDYQTVLQQINSSFPIQFQFSSTIVSSIATELFNWFSGYRVCWIPNDYPNAKEMFLADFFFVLSDILPQMLIKYFKINPDDFNIVDHRAETGKIDTTKVGTHEDNHSDSDNKTTTLLTNDVNQNITNETNTQNDYTKVGLMDVSNGTFAENVNVENDINTKAASDVFLSAQNEGVEPTNTNTRGKGVDGLTFNESGSFLTNTNHQNSGETDIDKTNTSSQTSDSTSSNTETTDSISGQNSKAETFAENIDTITTEQDTSTGLASGQNSELTNEKNDNLVETLNFDRFRGLHQLYDLYNERLWLEALSRLSRWILQINIATSEKNYVGYTRYPSNTNN